jgi:transcriptional regulator with XRE-family HTH domain
MSNFGTFLKEMRAKKGLTLREFCRLANVDPSNWSKVERGLLPPPKNRKTIGDIASVLLIEKGSEDWNTLFDLAAIGHIPAQLMATSRMGDRLTVFFRAARGDRAPTPKQIEQMIKAFKRNKG